MNPPKDIAEQLLTATAALLKHAQDGDLESLDPLQQQRAALIHQLDAALNSQAPELATTGLSDVLHRIRALEKETQAILVSRKKGLQDEHLKLKHGQRAQKAYGNPR